LALIMIGIGAIVGVIAGFSMVGGGSGVEEDGGSGLNGILLIIGSLVGAPVLAVLTRLFLESVAVLFRIANNTSDLAARR
jgi:hypothetical protein